MSNPSRNSVSKRLALVVLAPMALAAQMALAAGNINFSGEKFYPEGVTYSVQHQAFFVSSIYHGAVDLIDQDFGIRGADKAGSSPAVAAPAHLAGFCIESNWRIG